jgi:anti-sigma factor RsiW
VACDQWREKIERFADGELNADDHRAFQAHMRTCASCAAEALAGVQWKRAIGSAGKRYAPSAEFRERIARQVAPRKRPAWLGGWLPRLAVAALVLIAAGIFTQRWLASQQDRTFGELADMHVATLASTSPVDVVSSDRHTVKPWFAGKLPFSFNLPEEAKSPFTLVGGRMAYLDQMPGAQLIYQVRLHRISVFIFQDRGELWRPPIAAGKVARRASFNVETWSEGGLRYFIIGDASPDDIRQLGRLLRSAAKS